MVPEWRPNLMVIMAGGQGSRLRPHTENCPKPLLLVGGKPMLEHILERAKANGFQHFVVAVHYLGHMIEEYFGDGSRWQIEIEYLRENSPLGTAGALALLRPSPQCAVSGLERGRAHRHPLRRGSRLSLPAPRCQPPWRFASMSGSIPLAWCVPRVLISLALRKSRSPEATSMPGIYVLEPEALNALTSGGTVRHADLIRPPARTRSAHHCLPDARALAGCRPRGRPGARARTAFSRISGN